MCDVMDFNFTPVDYSFRLFHPCRKSTLCQQKNTCHHPLQIDWVWIVLICLKHNVWKVTAAGNCYISLAPAYWLIKYIEKNTTYSMNVRKVLRPSAHLFPPLERSVVYWYMSNHNTGKSSRLALGFFACGSETVFVCSFTLTNLGTWPLNGWLKWSRKYRPFQ